MAPLTTACWVSSRPPLPSTTRRGAISQEAKLTSSGVAVPVGSSVPATGALPPTVAAVTLPLPQASAGAPSTAASGATAYSGAVTGAYRPISPKAPRAAATRLPLSAASTRRLTAPLVVFRPLAVTTTANCALASAAASGGVE